MNDSSTWRPTWIPISHLPERKLNTVSDCVYLRSVPVWIWQGLLICNTCSYTQSSIFALKGLVQARNRENSIIYHKKARPCKMWALYILINYSEGSEHLHHFKPDLLHKNSPLAWHMGQIIWFKHVFSLVFARILILKYHCVV